MIRVVIKRPDEQTGHSTWISNTLETFQKHVEGPIEVIPYGWNGNRIIIVCNEEGRLQGLEPNCVIGGWSFVGTLIFCGDDGDDFADLPITFQEYKQFLAEVRE